MSRIPSSFDIPLDFDPSLDGDTIVDPGAVLRNVGTRSPARPSSTLLPPRPRAASLEGLRSKPVALARSRASLDLGEKTELTVLPSAPASSMAPATEREPSDTKGSTQRMHVSPLGAARRTSVPSRPSFAHSSSLSVPPAFFAPPSPLFAAPPEPRAPLATSDSLAPVAAPIGSTSLSVPVAADSLTALVGSSDDSWSVRPEELGTRSPFVKKARALGAVACAVGLIGLLATAGGKPTTAASASASKTTTFELAASPTVAPKAPELAAEARLTAAPSAPDFELGDTPVPVKPGVVAARAPKVEAKTGSPSVAAGPTPPKTQAKTDKPSKSDKSTKAERSTRGDDVEAAGAARVHAEANTAIADTL